MEKILLKNGQEVIVREPKKEEAQKMIDFYNVVGGETEFLSFGKNEFSMSLKEYESFIESTKTQDNSEILIAKVDNEIISIGTITSTQKAKGKHVGTLGIVISEKYCNVGLGTKIIKKLISLAKENGITKKINLDTNETNHRGIHLYKKLGFKEEGRLKNENYMNGVYSDIIVMGLMI